MPDTPDPTPTPPRPSWDDMRALVHNRGTDLDAPRTEPRGVIGAQHERWLDGHHYGPERPPLAAPSTPPRKRTRVEVVGMTPPTPPRGRRTPAAEAGATVDRLAARLRAQGVTSARIGVDHRGRPTIEVDDVERPRAARLLGSWTLGQT